MDHKGVKAITHASAFFAPVLVPLLVWLLMADREVKNTALQALLFHVIIGVLIAISWPFVFILIGIPFFVVFGLMALYYPDQRYFVFARRTSFLLSDHWRFGRVTQGER